MRQVLLHLHRHLRWCSSRVSLALSSAALRSAHARVWPQLVSQTRLIHEGKSDRGTLSTPENNRNLALARESAAIPTVPTTGWQPSGHSPPLPQVAPHRRGGATTLNSAVSPNTTR